MSRVWFITGCSKGFGMSLVEKILLSTSDYVVATARNTRILEDLLEKFSHRLLLHTLDVTSVVDAQAAVAKALEKYNRIDILVNNAGYGLVGALEELSMEEIHAVFATNVFGLMQVTQAVLPSMRSAKKGHIINFSSVAGVVGYPSSSIYSSTKFAVEGFSEALALDVAHLGIKVSIIEPGPFRTSFAGDSLKKAQAMEAYQEGYCGQMRDYFEHVHNKQTGDPDKAAECIIQLSAMETPMLRLPLGKMAFEKLQAVYKERLDTHNICENIALSADFSSA